MQFVCRDDGRRFAASVDDSGSLPTHLVVPVPRRPQAPAATAHPTSAGDPSGDSTGTSTGISSGTSSGVDKEHL